MIDHVVRTAAVSLDKTVLPDPGGCEIYLLTPRRRTCSSGNGLLFACMMRVSNFFDVTFCNTRYPAHVLMRVYHLRVNPISIP